MPSRPSQPHFYEGQDPRTPHGIDATSHEKCQVILSKTKCWRRDVSKRSVRKLKSKNTLEAVSLAQEIDNSRSCQSGHDVTSGDVNLRAAECNRRLDQAPGLTLANVNRFDAILFVSIIIRKVAFNALSYTVIRQVAAVDPERSTTPDPLVSDKPDFSGLGSVYSDGDDLLVPIHRSESANDLVRQGHRLPGRHKRVEDARTKVRPVPPDLLRFRMTGRVEMVGCADPVCHA